MTGTKKTWPKVFISYKHEDDSSQADRLARLLRRVWADEYVWMDTTFRGGEEWWQEILDKLQWCDSLIYLTSAESVASVFCRAEFTEAWAQAKCLLPVKLRGKQLPAAISRRIQNSADLSKNGGFPTEDTLADVIAGIVQNKRAPVEPAPDIWRMRKTAPNAAGDGIVYEFDVSAEVEPDSKSHVRCNTGILYMPGDVVRIEAQGTVVVNRQDPHPLSADGVVVEGPWYYPSFKGYLTKGNPIPPDKGTSLVGSLFGWIGHEGPKDAFFVGSNGSVPDGSKPGFLHLAVNDEKGTYGDNEGAFQITIEHTHSAEITD